MKHIALLLLAALSFQLPAFSQPAPFNYPAAASAGVSASGGSLTNVTIHWQTNSGDILFSTDSAYAIGSSSMKALRIWSNSFRGGVASLDNVNDANNNITHLSLGAANMTVGSTVVQFSGSIDLPKTITAPGTTGNQTINKAMGRVNIAATGTSVIVTNSLVTANSIIHAVAATADATARVTSVVAATGTFTINTVATTAETAFNFILVN